MAHQTVVAAVHRRLAEHWTHCPVVGMNEGAEAPEDGSPFIVVQFPASRTDRVSVGTPYYREEGGFRFVLNLPRGEGTTRALLWASELAKLFRYEEFDGVKCDAPTSPFMDDSNDVGAYFIATVVCTYHYDFVDMES